MDPYPDLHGDDLHGGDWLSGALPGAADGGPADEGQRPELSEADSRLLDALSQPTPAVVSAVEDQPRTAAADGVLRRPAGARSALAPVFREPTD